MDDDEGVGSDDDLASLATVSGTKLAQGPGAGLVNMRNLMATKTMLARHGVKKEVSWTKILADGHRIDEHQDWSDEPVLFSDGIKRSNAEGRVPGTGLNSRFHGPNVKDSPLNELARKPGHVPVLNLFHVESHRERAGSEDDGLEIDDLTATDGLIRKPKDLERKQSRRRSFENMKLIKGEFTFPHRTYRPKVQVAYRVPPGQVPQAVVIERLHRLYRRTDINLVCQTLGIEISDLIPPPHYGETSERFYQESMWRNRTRISGMEKRDFIINGGRAAQEDAAGVAGHFGKKQNSDSQSSSESGTTSSGEGENKEEEEQTEHPFIKSKPPFGPQFPLEHFDNDEFDIRPADEWIELGWDFKDNQMYPIPGKAFLPMPLAGSRMSVPALSEVTAVNLLKKSEPLETFRKWLIKERYKRQVMLMGGKYSPSHVPSEMEMTLVARTATTVPTLFHTTTSSTTSGALKDHDSSSSQDSLLKIYSGEIGGESDPGTPDDSYISLNFDHHGSDDILSQLQRTTDESGQSAGTPQDALAIDGVKRSESILSDIFSDPNSLLALTAAAPGTGKQLGISDDVEVREIDESEVYVLHDARGAGAASGFFGPSSPDIDPYEDGNNEFVYDYCKMKKVHNYDWKWVDVAVFAYDAGTRKFFVRSIFPPFVFAWVSKIYLLMDGEDPNTHGERIKDAVSRRIETEGLMRYNLYVDCLPTTKAAPLSDTLLKVIMRKTLSTPQLKYDDKVFDKIKKEMNLEYKRTHMRLLFDHIVEKHPHMYKPWVQSPEHYEDTAECNTDWRPMAERYHECRTSNFGFKCTRLLRESVLYKEEPYQALLEIAASCLKARERPFLLSNQESPIGIDLYEQRQMEQMAEVQEYLKEEWMKAVLDSIRENLGSIPRSWYNIEEGRWDVFNMSKSSKYLTLVRFIMQDTLRFMVEDSLNAFVTELEKLTEACANIKKSYKWQNTLLLSDFPTPVGMSPIFQLDLTIDKDGPKYSQLLSRFPKSLTQIFLNCIESSCGIPDIVPQIMQGLLFGTSRTLQSVEKAEDAIMSLKANLNKFLRRGLIPVDVYAQKFKYYLPVWNLDLAQFTKEWSANDEHTTKEIKLTVDFHMRHLEEIEAEIPASIDIGAFRINVEFVKQGLLKKKKALYTSILDNFAAKLRNIILQIRSDYDFIERKLTTRSDDIEEVMEMKAYCTGVEGIIIRKGEQIERVVKDYELFEKFKYKIPLEDFESKWSAAMGTTKMLRIAVEAVGWLDDDYDRLLKVQQADLSSLSDQVDSTTLAVSGLIAYVELEKASEVQQEVKKVWKQVKDLQETSALLNRRQKIFGLPPAQNEALIRLGKDIEPFKSLWFTAADWLRLQEAIFQGTLDKVDINAVKKMITEGGRTIRHCVKYFKGADAIQHIAEEVKHQIHEFKPLVPLVRMFKNPGLRQRHLEAISDICGVTIVAKGNQSFKKLLEQGIGEHIPEIEAIDNMATHELEIERSMERMQREVNSFKLSVSKDGLTGVQIVVYPAGVQQLIETFIQATEAMLVSQYKAPFEEQLGTWDKKVRLTKDNLDLWIVDQNDWIELQESFKIPDVETKIPTEHKLFVKMERIWRRVMRLVRDTPDVLDIGSDTTLRASLLQFSTLVYRVRKGLEEYMRPTNSDSDDDAQPAT